MIDGKTVKYTGDSVSRKDNPVLVQLCQHGKVFRKTALMGSKLSLKEILAELEPSDKVAIVPASEMLPLMRCGKCGF